jgi:hypothetical protein
VRTFEHTPPCAFRASQRRWAGGRPTDQFRMNANIFHALIVYELANQKLRRRCTHLLQWLANGRQRRICNACELESSKPMTETSSGTLRPTSRNAVIAPRAERSLKATSAVKGLLPQVNHALRYAPRRRSSCQGVRAASTGP